MADVLSMNILAFFPDSFTDLEYEIVRKAFSGNVFAPDHHETRIYCRRCEI